MVKLNEDFNIEIMIYIRNNLKPKANGKYFKIPVLHIVRDLKQFSSEEIYLTISFLLENKLITKTNPESKTSPKATSVNGITSKGHTYIETIENQTLWYKFKKNLSINNITNLINAGFSAIQIINYLTKDI